VIRQSTDPGPEAILRYGPHPDQWAHLYLPHGQGRALRGTVVIVHGGYWRDRYTAELGVPAAQDLVRHGFAVWNLEYRRAGSDSNRGAGGWPATFGDIAAGIDFLATIAERYGLDLQRVVMLGHSAGGHLAVWAAGRHKLPPDAPGGAPAVTPVGVVSQAGLLHLATAERLGLSDHAVRNLMGGTSAELEGPFELADPTRALPIGVPVHAVHSRADDLVPFMISAEYVTRARAAGDPAELHEVTGDHFSVIDPAQDAYRVCRDLLERLLP
jgi:acetyl esterase/lipase